MNYGALGIFVLFLCFTLIVHYNTKKAPKGFYFMVLLGFTLFLYEGYDAYTTAIRNINIFKTTDVVFKCSSGGGAYSFANIYRVSAKDGWSVSHRYFVKDSLAIGTEKCEQW
ncbi:hypothetical protein JHD48_07770 [Sulfurimonas sp. SAG-AH-194-I05]|nr:hypothetical protein [Sulfurimonas sp. SAG-AH-194-I05]MDF1875628.1 hypothetical protein [Sulfurimonas sp. SAG-AH-194-I05]